MKILHKFNSKLDTCQRWIGKPGAWSSDKYHPTPKYAKQLEREMVRYLTGNIKSEKNVFTPFFLTL